MDVAERKSKSTLNKVRGRQKKSGLTYLNQQNSVNILAVGAYYTPNEQRFYKNHAELYKFDIGAVIHSNK